MVVTALKWMCTEVHLAWEHLEPQWLKVQEAVGLCEGVDAEAETTWVADSTFKEEAWLVMTEGDLAEVVLTTISAKVEAEVAALAEEEVEMVPEVMRSATTMSM